MRSKFWLLGFVMVLIGCVLTFYRTWFPDETRHGYEMKALLGVRAERISIAYYLDHSIDPELTDEPDLWGSKIKVLIENGMIHLQSAGPDRTFQTPDDINVEVKAK